MALFQNNTDIQQEQAGKDAATAADEQMIAKMLEKVQSQQEQTTTKLSLYVEKIWQENQIGNKQNRLDMVKLARRCRGEYEPAKLAAIRAFKGSEVFVRLSENKARAAESWIKDIYRGDADTPWVIEPTAIPDLPDETIAQLQQETQMRGQQIEAEIAMSGAVPDRMAVAKLMNEWYEEALDRAKQELVNDAKERCERASKLIKDQNQEGGWNNAFKDFLWYFVRFKAGIIKGPILTKKPKQMWTPNEEGGYSITTEEVLVNDVYAVSPFNFYPSRGMSKINDGNVIEIHELSKQAISSLIGVPGYSEKEIRAVLDEYSRGDLKAKWFTIDDETAVRQVEKERNTQLATNPPTSNTTSTNKEENIFAQEFYGTVPGNLLIEWGVEGEIDPNMQYQANCWKIGKHIIKAVVNPDPLGRKPYHVSSWAKNPSWIWGEGLVEFAEPVEDILNAIVRAHQNNIAIASGPQVEINVDRCDDKSPMYPWKRWFSTGSQMRESKAIEFYQPEMHSGELIASFQHFSKLLDDMTVPAYVQGASQSGVTAGTATVFTQLLAAASRSIKAVVANLDDDIITPYITMCYDYNMKFGDDNATKGDARVVAKGVAGLMAKEQSAQRKVEYLQAVANPVFSQLLGNKNLGAILGDIAKSNDISLPDMARLDGSADIEMQIQQILMAQAGVADPNQANGQIGAGGTGANPQGQNPDGSKAGVNNG